MWVNLSERASIKGKSVSLLADVQSEYNRSQNNFAALLGLRSNW